MTMKLLDIIARKFPPAPWTEGDNIPWDDPDFSERMLKEHLTQEHDLASRRFETIDRQVAWIHEEVLAKRSARILELTCGPGLYLNRLAGLGHECVGIDFSPASIRHAEETARTQGVSCTCKLGNVLEADFGEDLDLVMMNNGQINVFRRDDALRILRKAHAALAKGGTLLLEPLRFETVETTGKGGTSWYTCGEGGGLFSGKPHLCLQESSWDPDAQCATQRFFIIDPASGEVTRHALTTEAYTDPQIREALAQAGFADIRFIPSLTGEKTSEPGQSEYQAIVASRKSDK